MRILNASGTPNLSGLLARIRAGIHRSITGNDTFKCKSQSVNGPFFAIHAMSNFAGVKLCLEPAQQAQIHRKSKTTHPAAVRGDLCTRYQTTALAPTWLLVLPDPSRARHCDSSHVVRPPRPFPFFRAYADQNIRTHSEGMCTLLSFADAIVTRLFLRSPICLRLRSSIYSFTLLSLTSHRASANTHMYFVFMAHLLSELGLLWLCTRPVYIGHHGASSRPPAPVARLSPSLAADPLNPY